MRQNRSISAHINHLKSAETNSFKIVCFRQHKKLTKEVVYSKWLGAKLPGVKVRDLKKI